MFEGLKIIRNIKKLTTNYQNVDALMVSQLSPRVKQRIYSAEDAAGIIVETALTRDLIKREDLTSEGETMISYWENINKK